MKSEAQQLSSVERIVRQDHLVVAASLAVVSMLAWLYLLRMASAMEGAASEMAMHEAMGMSEMANWSVRDAGMLFVMWAVMMAGMMLPSAAPIMLLVVGTYRRRGDRQARLATAFFVAGYLAAWVGFSAAAALAQTSLHQAALMSSAMRLSFVPLSGAIFIAAGVYQWAPWKQACLQHCRAPLQFLTEHWREGAAGGFLLGLRHGLYCVGCCWALMLLLFAAGVMNLLWVAAIAAFVLAEKLLPRARLFGRVAGITMMAWGAYLLFVNLSR